MHHALCALLSNSPGRTIFHPLNPKSKIEFPPIFGTFWGFFLQWQKYMVNLT